MPAQFVQKQFTPDLVSAVEEGVRWFSSFVAAGADLQNALMDAARGQGRVWHVLTLRLADVLEGGRGLIGARMGGWRASGRAGTGVIAGDLYTVNTVERSLPYPVAAGAPRLACIRKGDEISKMLSTIDKLAVAPLVDQIPPQMYNLDLLLLPGLVTEVLWLQPQQAGAADWVVPYNTLITGLQEGQLYSEDQFLQAVRPVARRWVAYRKQEASRVMKDPRTGKMRALPVHLPRSVVVK
jgi:hypothetical protein